MTKTYGQKLSEAIKLKGLKQQDIALDLHMDPAVLSKVINGRLKAPKWLSEKLATHIELGLDLKTLRGWEVEEAFQKEAILSASNVFKIPVYGPDCPAGFPTSLDAYKEDEIEVFFPNPAQAIGSFAVKIKGNSMVDAGILDGSHIIVNPDIQGQPGQIVLACIDGEYTCKEYRVINEKHYLYPHNPNFEPIEITSNNTQILKVLMAIKTF